MATKKQYQETSIGLNEKDRGRLAELSRLQGRTKTEVAREAIRWYMDNYEQIKSQSRESRDGPGDTVRHRSAREGN